MAKCFEDSLRSLGVLEDDDPKHVARTVLEVVMVPKEKNKKKSGDMGKKEIKKDEDWVEITIRSINHKD